MKMKKIALLSVVGLAACGPSSAEREKNFADRCLAAQFTPAQCGVLWSMFRATENAQLTGTVAVGIGSTAIGTSAGKK